MLPIFFTVFPSFFVSTPHAFSAFTVAVFIFLAPALILSQFLYTSTAAIAIAPSTNAIFPPGPMNVDIELAFWKDAYRLFAFPISPPTFVVKVPIITTAGPTAATIIPAFTINFCVLGDNFENLSDSSLNLLATFVAGGATTWSTTSPKIVKEFFATFTAFLILLIDVCISFNAFCVDP